MDAGTGAVVTGLHIFPVKSCRGVAVEEIEVDSFGVVGDRRYMLVDGNNRFTSQRKLPRLALVEVSFAEGKDGKTQLKFSAPGTREFLLEPVLTGERKEVTIWEDTVMAIDQGDEVAKWFNEFIGMSSSHLRLVASAESFGGGFQRPVSHLPVHLKDRLSHQQMALPDDGPVSIVSHESLADLNQRIRERGGEEVSLKQFRMNIEVSGCSEPFEEDRWHLIQIGSAHLLVYRDAEVCCCTVAGGMWILCKETNDLCSQLVWTVGAVHVVVFYL